MTSKDFIRTPLPYELHYVYSNKNAREKNIVNPKMVVKFTILVPCSIFYRGMTDEA